MLDTNSVIPFLLKSGLIDIDWIIDGCLTIRCMSRRNRNLSVEGCGTGFLVKQPDGLADRGSETLASEASFHNFCLEEPLVADMMHLVPRLVYNRVEDVVLVFELISNANSFRTASTSEFVPSRMISNARALGRALATIHRVFRHVDIESDRRLRWLPRLLPWILGVHRPSLANRARLSQAQLEILRVVQTHAGFGEHVGRSKGLWRPETLIHGDIRFDNVLVRSGWGDDDGDDLALWVVDWEMVQLGDPAWDLAGALQDFLVSWVSSMPLSNDLTIEEITARARVSLDDLRAGSRALWAGYRVAAGLDGVEAAGLLRRAVEFAAVRLIQSAYEISAESDHLFGQPVLLLQISANLLADPELGQVQLFGIPPGSVAS
jgi:hypothetical protein